MYQSYFDPTRDAQQAREITADQDAAIACETMRHAVIAAHQGADAFEVEHVALSVSRGHVLYIAWWGHDGCASWRKPIPDSMMLCYT